VSPRRPDRTGVFRRSRSAFFKKTKCSRNLLPNFMQYVTESLETVLPDSSCHSERSAAKSRNLWSFYETNLKSEMSRLPLDMTNDI
jgi:hypothetical protein